MNKHFVLSILLAVFFSQIVTAQDWESISAPDSPYYWGTGTDTNEEVAGKHALDNLLQQISVHVSSNYNHVYDGVASREGIDFKEVVSQVVNTYSSAALTNVQTWPFVEKDKKDGMVTIRKYMLRSDLEKIYEQRRNRVFDMISLAESNLENKKVDVALQYFYWAYTLVRSLQFPSEVKDASGNILINTLPARIRDIIKDIRIDFVGVEDDFVDLRFTYQDAPISADFTYNDGNRDDVEGRAEGGNASLEMAPGHAENDSYHILVEYMYLNAARGDDEMESVLNALPPVLFGEQKIVRRKNSESPAHPAPTTDAREASSAAPSTKPSAVSVAPSCDLVAEKTNVCVERMQNILEALRTHRYEQAYNCFTGRGEENYRRMVCERKGRLVGEEKFTLYTAPNGRVMARGLQMSFSVAEKTRKTTLVDDVVFTFNSDGKVENLSFGIGTQSEKDLLAKEVQWGEDVRQAVLDFLENYKTAYCLKDSDFIETVFSDDAVIITGYVARPAQRKASEYEGMPEVLPQIKYRKYTKAEYVQNLKKSFRRNKFVNIKFTNNDIQIDEELFPEKKVFFIRIGQEYTSSTYSDIGYLFLRVDITNPQEPAITFRTWQPSETPLDEVFTRGHFNL